MHPFVNLVEYVQIKCALSTKSARIAWIRRRFSEQENPTIIYFFLSLIFFSNPFFSLFYAGNGAVKRWCNLATSSASYNPLIGNIFLHTTRFPMPTAPNLRLFVHSRQWKPGTRWQRMLCRQDHKYFTVHLDPANIRSAFFQFPVISDPKPSSLDLSFRHLFSAISNYFSFPLKVQNREIQLYFAFVTFFNLNPFLRSNVWMPCSNRRHSDITA